MKTRPDETTKRLAATIARALFTDVDNRRASRLVMEHAPEPGIVIFGAGWGERAMADRIAELLHAAQSPRPKGARR